MNLSDTIASEIKKTPILNTTNNKNIQTRVLQIMSKKSSEKSKPPKKLDAQNKEERIWKIVYIILCLALLTLTAYQLITMLRDNGYGWDFLVFRGGVQAIDHMQNPYILKKYPAVHGRGDTSSVCLSPEYTLYLLGSRSVFCFREYGNLLRTVNCTHADQRLPYRNDGSKTPLSLLNYSHANQFYEHILEFSHGK